VAAERAKGASAVLKLGELQQLLRDKTQALDTLRRQLMTQADGGSQGSVRPHQGARSAGAGERSGRVVSGNSRDRRALELLRASGRLAGKRSMLHRTLYVP
jgi:hypothetical protein